MFFEIVKKLDTKSNEWHFKKLSSLQFKFHTQNVRFKINPTKLINRVFYDFIGILEFNKRKKWLLGQNPIKNSIPPKIGKLSDHRYASNSLTSF